MPLYRGSRDVSIKRLSVKLGHIRVRPASCMPLAGLKPVSFLLGKNARRSDVNLQKLTVNNLALQQHCT